MKRKSSSGRDEENLPAAIRPRGSAGRDRSTTACLDRGDLPNALRSKGSETPCDPDRLEEDQDTDDFSGGIDEDELDEDELDTDRVTSTESLAGGAGVNLVRIPSIGAGF